VEDALRAKVKPAHIEGYDRAEWVLMDFFTFIVHVFTPQTREFYSLERLWGEAERIEVSDEPTGPARA
jgi:ribosome-associated protein